MVWLSHVLFYNNWTKFEAFYRIKHASLLAQNSNEISQRFYDIVYKRSIFSKKFLLDGGSVLNPGITNYRSVYTSNNFISQTHQWLLSIVGFVKNARISNVIIQDRPKTIRTVSWWYHDDTGIVLAVVLDVLLIPSDTNQYQVC